MSDYYFALWRLTSDGDPIITVGASLLPAPRCGEAAMLKIVTEPEGKFAGDLLVWWNGRGAARALATDGAAIVIEPALGGRSLSELDLNGRDGEVTPIICDAIVEPHAPRTKLLPELIPLSVWFGHLEPAATAQGGILSRSAEAACALLAEPREVEVLHGDIHHDNILDSASAAGWPSIPSALEASAASIMRTCSATRTSAIHRPK